VALACLEAGRHVLTEKPMAGTFEQAQRLVGAARRNGVQLVVGYLRLHDDGVQEAKRLLDRVRQSGELGRETFVRVHCFQGEGWNNLGGHLVSDEPLPDGEPGWPTAPDWLPDQHKLDYARYVNVHCHQVSLLRYLTGRTLVVDHARLDHQRGRVAVLDFGDYAGVLETGQMDHRGWDDLVEVYFERGRLRLDLPPGMLRNVAARVELLHGDARQQQVRSIQSDWTWAFQNQARSFVEAVRGGHSNLARGEDAAEDLRIIESIWQQQLRIQQPALEVA
jgi:predicted dehydrogenase